MLLSSARGTSWGARTESNATPSVPTDKIAIAERVATDAHRMLSGAQLIPHRIEASANEFRSALRALPSEQSVAVLLRNARLPIPEQLSLRLQPLRSVTTLRAMLIAELDRDEVETWEHDA